MTKKEVKVILGLLRMSPKKSKGQNFLLSKSVISQMLAKIPETPVESFLEIGPGLGVLTNALSAQGLPVYSVELDNTLSGYLESQFAEKAHVHILNEDILDFDPSSLPQPYGVVANLPYQITSAIFKKLLSHSHKPAYMLVMIQKEVAQRICETTGRHSVLSLSVQYFGTPNIEFGVSRTDFYPIPQVDSAILSVTDIKERNATETKQFFRLVKAGFSHKRKKLLSNLADHGLFSKEEGRTYFQELGLEEGVRAQHLSMEQWISLQARIFGDN